MDTSNIKQYSLLCPDGIEFLKLKNLTERADIQAKEYIKSLNINLTKETEIILKNSFKSGFKVSMLEFLERFVK